MKTSAEKLGQRLIKVCRDMGLTPGDFIKAAEEAHMAAVKMKTIEPITARQIQEAAGKIFDASETAKEQYIMTWKEVENRIRILGIDVEGCKVFGVPRGGLCACHSLRKAEVVLLPGDADVILDDIIQSGTTMWRYKQHFPRIPFVALMDKSAPWKCTSIVTADFEAFENPDFGDCIEWADHQFGWVVFPWEQDGLGMSPLDTAEDNILRLLQVIGENPARDGLLDTPKRVIKMLREMTAGYKMNPKEVLGKVFEQDMDEMIILRGIRFTSLCEHHMLPFLGTVSIGYIPRVSEEGRARGLVVGLSKLARVVEIFAKRLQLQERMTIQIADSIQEALNPRGVGVIVKAHHTCIGCRGVKQPESTMITSCMRGLFRTEIDVRNEFLRLIENNG